MAKGKIKEFVGKNKAYIDAFLFGAVLGGVSYTIGYKTCDRKYQIGLGTMCAADPELYGRMKDAAKAVEDRIG